MNGLRPHDLARNIFEEARDGIIPLANGISALQRHLGAYSGEGARVAQIERWIEILQKMEAEQS